MRAPVDSLGAAVRVDRADDGEQVLLQVTGAEAELTERHVHNTLLIRAELNLYPP